MQARLPPDERTALEGLAFREKISCCLPLRNANAVCAAATCEAFSCAVYPVGMVQGTPSSRSNVRCVPARREWSPLSLSVVVMRSNGPSPVSETASAGGEANCL